MYTLLRGVRCSLTGLQSSADFKAQISVYNEYHRL